MAKKKLLFVLLCLIVLSGIFVSIPKKDNIPWYKRITAYQILINSFYDSNGDGLGDLPGVLAKMDYIASLNANTLYLMPVNSANYELEFLRSYFGYEAIDLKAVSSSYGTAEDLKAVVDSAHQKGMKVILDFTTTVISKKNAMFQDVNARADSPYRSWFITADEIPDGNWMNFNDYPYLRKTQPWYPLASGGYYYSLWGDLPYLNYHNPQVQDYVLSCFDYWLDLGVDGFRLDAAKHLFVNGPGPALQTHQNENIEFWKRLRAHITEKYGDDKTLIAEIVPIPTNMPYLYPNRETFDTLTDFSFVSAVMPFDFYSAPEAVDARVFHNFFDNFLEFQATPLSDRMFYWSDQDKGRLGDRLLEKSPELASEQLKMLASLIIFSPTQFKLFYGEELGVWTIDSVENKSLHAWKNSNLVTFPWDKGKNAGFSTAETVLPVGRETAGYNFERQDKDPNSLLNFYRQALKVKNTYPDLFFMGTRKTITLPDSKLYAFYLTNKKRTVLVLTNLSNRPKNISFDIPDENVQQIFGSVSFNVKNKMLSVRSLSGFSTTIFLLPSLKSDFFEGQDVNSFTKVSINFNQKFVAEPQVLYTLDFNNHFIKFEKGQGIIDLSLYVKGLFETSKYFDLEHFKIDTTNRDVFIPMTSQYNAITVSPSVRFELDYSEDPFTEQWKTRTVQEQNRSLRQMDAFCDDNFWYIRLYRPTYLMPDHGGFETALLIDSDTGQAELTGESIYELPWISVDRPFDVLIGRERPNPFAKLFTGLKHFRERGIENSRSLLFWTKDQYEYYMIPRTILSSSTIGIQAIIWSAMGKWGDVPVPSDTPILEHLE